MTHKTFSFVPALALAFAAGLTALPACDVDFEGYDDDATALDDSHTGTHAFDTTPGADAIVNLQPAASPVKTTVARLRPTTHAAPVAPSTVVLNARRIVTNAVSAAWIRALPTLVAGLSEDIERLALDALIADETSAAPPVSVTAHRPLAAGWTAWMRNGQAIVVQAQPESSLGEGLAIDWIAGPPTYASDGDEASIELTRLVYVDRLPAHIRRLQGHTLRLLGEAGELCTATVAGFELRSSYRRDASLDWQAEDGAEQQRSDRVALSPAEAWEKGIISLSAVLETSGDVCEGALLATDALQPAPAFATTTALSRGLEMRALRAFRAHPAYIDEQSFHTEALSFDSATATPGRWEYYEGSRPTIYRYLDASSGREFVTVSAYSSTGCGGPGGSMTATFEVQRTTRGVPSLSFFARGSGAPVGLVDIDGDAKYELLMTGDWSRVETPGEKGDVEPVLEFVLPDYTNYECPC